MAERRDRIEELGGEAVFVVHDEPEPVRARLLEGLDVPYPVLIDLERKSYRQWGLRRASFAEVYLDPKVWLQYARLVFGRGERLSKGGRDTLQLGGDFVVGRDGRFVYSRPQDRDDRPPVGELIRKLQEAA